ncbi:uncharacterized protein BDR25DRAFT_302513 [Lindgomyces ingoldianus]|uniref:Uncharacterized protein n=1 Tax=Lindgomyces ingoldianus TaxID=673940 RepID=A0ACB6R1F8_9PLEO|nr:uncharacterized protein BDR25DRAFT_302513 [Lindgomyces ingoldianus]KAF2472920.1 hypothetical protein BDR25DRAFT_302513 [Lindgomyces ingoldianus]
MSSALAASPHLHGNGVVLPDTPREVEFLDKLLQIRDEVLGSKHARIHLPPKVLEQVAPRPAQQTPPFPSRPTTNGTPNGSHSSHPFPPRPESSLQHYLPVSGYSSPAQPAQRPYTSKSASSGIDPVLLTKSDHLIRAELQLKRQQIERGLKDQFDKKGREKDNAIEEAQLDVEGVLAKATELVKPLSGLQIAANHSESSESFDENSYYSSQAYSWSSEEVDPNRHGIGADTTVPLTQQAKHSATEAQLTTAKAASRVEPKPRQADTALIDLDEEPYEPADDIEIYEPELAQARDEREESEYSPPPADVTTLGPNRGRGQDRGQNNHGGINGSSRRHSPAGHPAPIHNTRKRRREERHQEKQKERQQEKREEKRRQQANNRVVRSPEPIIKEEPQSPPPFATYPDSQPNKRRALQPLEGEAEVVSPRDSRQQPVYYREQEPSSRLSRQYEEPLSPTVIRVPQRRLERDEQDLRRVASLQYARRPISPVGAEPLAYAPAETRQVRAASHAFVDRPLEPVYREVPARASVAPRYIRDRSRSPAHEYVSRNQSPVMMAPPPRRIVVDQYGNKYYASPADVRESVAPPSRRMEAEPYYERAVTREPTIRAPARPDLYEEGDAQRMPPPPRRYIDPSDAEVVEARPYRQRELSHRPVDLEYAPREVVERRPVIQYEEMGPPREYVPSRAYSVRPEVVRREVPAEYAPVRHESIAPGGYVRVAAPRYRELSVIQDAAYDDRRYTFASQPQPRRYMEEGSGAERPVEVPQEPFVGEPRRVSYRY